MLILLNLRRHFYSIQRLADLLRQHDSVKVCKVSHFVTDVICATKVQGLVVSRPSRRISTSFSTRHSRTLNGSQFQISEHKLAYREGNSRNGDKGAQMSGLGFSRDENQGAPPPTSSPGKLEKV